MRSNFIKLISVMLAVSLFVLCFSPVFAAKKKKKAAVYDILNFNAPVQYMGLYFKGVKAGFSSMQLSHKKGQVVFEAKMKLQIVTGDQTVTQNISDKRYYNYKTGRLTMIQYSNKGSTGETKIRGVVNGNTMTMFTTAGGQVFEETLTGVTDSLENDFAIEIAILSGKIKMLDKFENSIIDPSVKRTITVRQKLIKIESRMINGINKKIYITDGSHVEMNATLNQEFDEQARLLKSTIAGFLEMRWETEKQAKNMDNVGSFLEPSVVLVDKKLKHSTSSIGLQAMFTGVPDSLAINNERQQWGSSAAGIRQLEITQESIGYKGSKPAKLSEEERAKYLAHTARIQVNDKQIHKIVKKLQTKAKNNQQLTSLMLDWVFTNIEKVYTPTQSNALETLNSKQGDCGEHSVLLVALLRAAGLPSREVTGVVYSEQIGGFGFHAWAEVWLGHWVSIDPSWNQFPVDATHIAFAKGGLSEQVKIISLIGSLQVKSVSIK